MCGDTEAGRLSNDPPVGILHNNLKAIGRAEGSRRSNPCSPCPRGLGQMPLGTEMSFGPFSPLGFSSGMELTGPRQVCIPAGQGCGSCSVTCLYREDSQGRASDSFAPRRKQHQRAESPAAYSAGCAPCWHWKVWQRACLEKAHHLSTGSSEFSVPIFKFSSERERGRQEEGRKGGREGTGDQLGGWPALRQAM